jgi:hypothetical protein
MTYIFNTLIYVDMILLNNLLQYLLFIVMIDTFRTYSTATSLICYALVMFMIYSEIKIKLKVLIYLSFTKKGVVVILSEPTLRCLRRPPPLIIEHLR